MRFVQLILCSILILSTSFGYDGSDIQPLPADTASSGDFQVTHRSHISTIGDTIQHRLVDFGFSTGGIDIGFSCGNNFKFTVAGEISYVSDKLKTGNRVFAPGLTLGLQWLNLRRNNVSFRFLSAPYFYGIFYKGNNYYSNSYLSRLGIKILTVGPEVNLGGRCSIFIQSDILTMEFSDFNLLVNVFSSSSGMLNPCWSANRIGLRIAY
jgi:hypothetical protein